MTLKIIQNDFNYWPYIELDMSTQSFNFIFFE